MTWTLIARVPRGHKFFRDNATGRVAIADNSGGTPEYTEDGILWLDPTRPLRVTIGGSDFTAVSYPLISARNGGTYWSGCGLSGLGLVLRIWRELAGRVELDGIEPATLRALADALTNAADAAEGKAL